MELLTNSWKHTATGTDGDVQLFGVNVFDYKWNNTRENAQVVDPLHNQLFNFTVYSVVINETIYKFAAGEFSNGIWGFYIQK